MKHLSILLIFSFCLIFINVYGQKNKITSSVKASSYDALNAYIDNPILISGEFSYYVIPAISAGVYLGVGSVMKTEQKYQNDIYYYEKSSSPFYGITVCGFLDEMFKLNANRLDVFLLAKYGGLYRLKPDFNYDQDKGHETEYGLGVGINVIFWKNFGLSAEYMYGKFTYQADMRYGIGLFGKF